MKVGIIGTYLVKNDKLPVKLTIVQFKKGYNNFGALYLSGE